MTNQDQIEPCPFCGDKLVRITDVHGDPLFRHSVANSECIGNIDLINQRDFDRWNRRVSPWQPMETAPRDRPIMLWHRAKATWIPCKFKMVWPSTGEVCWDVLNGGNSFLYGPGLTHWCELPVPPAEDEKEGAFNG